MKSAITHLLLCLICVPLLAVAATPAGVGASKSSKSASVSVPDSAQLETDLQSLSWEQFRAVISAVPKMKADVDAYGKAGWEYVRARYKTYGWKKNIDKLDPAQRKHLAEMIKKVRNGSATQSNSGRG